MPDCCATCALWIVARVVAYEDGSVIEKWKAPPGKGRCELLGVDVPGEFGCNQHKAGEAHEVEERKDGAPWQHWTMIPCPDCSGAGSSNDRPDDRCAGTGKVRLYDDGHVGDERTRVHPKELELRGRKRTCAQCGQQMAVDWKACPHCGARLEDPAATEQVGGLDAGAV